MESLCRFELIPTCNSILLAFRFANTRMFDSQKWKRRNWKMEKRREKKKLSGRNGHGKCAMNMIDIGIVWMHRLSISQHNGWQTNLSSVQPQAFFNIAFFFLFFLVAFRGDKMKKISIEIRSTNCTMKSVKLRITIKYKYALLFWITYSASTHSMAHSTINWHTFFPIEERKKKSHTIKSFSIFAF